MTDIDYTQYVPQVGDLVFLLPTANNNAADYTAGRPNMTSKKLSGVELEINAKGPFEVTRVTTNYIWVRFPAPFGYGADGTTVKFYRADGEYSNTPSLRPVGTDYVPPRKLGQTPEGDHIDITDPRIQWIWDDLGKYADSKNWCNQYDTLADGMGIPGRERAFKVSKRVDDLTISGTIRARSQAEADAVFAAKTAGLSA